MAGVTAAQRHGIVLELYDSLGPAKGLQVSLSDAHAGHGVRLSGPSFIGNSKLLRRIQIDKRVAKLMKPYVEKALVEENAPTAGSPAVGGGECMTTDEIIAEAKREARDDQTYVVLRALRRVLSHKTDPKLVEAIVADVLEELRREA